MTLGKSCCRHTYFMLWCYWFNSLKTREELLYTAFIFVEIALFFSNVEQSTDSVEGAF